MMHHSENKTNSIDGIFMVLYKNDYKDAIIQKC